MTPPPDRRIAAMAGLLAFTMVVTLTRIWRSHSASETSAMVRATPIPTLFTRMSRRPQRSMAAATIWSQAAGSVTSAACGADSPFCSAM